MVVQTYDELVSKVARILHYNREYVMYYRGQSKDYLDSYLKTIISPSIFRKKKDGIPRNLKHQFDLLKSKSVELLSLFYGGNITFAGTHLIKKYPEIAWSLLQHYEICDTPLLDLSHSLHVACSFAFDRNSGNTGIVYVLGMPWQTDAIGYNSFEEIVNLRLLNVCPPSAKRPFFQEGYLAGPFPNYKLDDPKRSNQFDFNRRLIAKFEIPIEKSFWGDGFDKILPEKLYQKDDKILNLLKVLKQK